MSTGPAGFVRNALSGGATATIVVAVQLDTTAATPFTVTSFPARKPIPPIVICPPATLVTAGCTESAYNPRAWYAKSGRPSPRASAIATRNPCAVVVRPVAVIPSVTVLNAEGVDATVGSVPVASVAP